MTGALVRWQHPGDGTLISFQDVRPEAKTAALEPELLILPSRREVAGHEARHAAASLLLGIRVTEARADWPGVGGSKGHVVGYVRYGALDWNRPTSQRKSAVATLVGDMSKDRDPQAVGYTGQWPPAWPPTNKLGADSDEAVLAEYVKTAGLDEAGWKSLCDEARDLAAMDEFKQLAASIGVLLEHGTVMNERMLTHAYEMVMKASLAKIRKRISALGAEIKQMNRGLDERTQVDPELERVRQETRDGIYAYLQAVDQAAAETAPAPLIPADTKHCAPMRTSNRRGSMRTSVFPATITTQ